MSSAVRVAVAARSHRGRLAAKEDPHLIVRLGRHREALMTSLPEGDVAPKFEETGYALVVADGIGSAGRGATAARR